MGVRASDNSVLDGSHAIEEAKLTAGTLRITEQDDVQFDIKVTGADQAPLQLVTPPHSEFRTALFM